jgi:predicted component of type VI protein secretion system
MKLYLVVVQGKAPGRILLFPPGEFTFGRSQECHIRPEGAWISRRHCSLCVGDDFATISDLGSRNGTLVNGERVTGTRALQSGDRIQMGALVFEVSFDDPRRQKADAQGPHDGLNHPHALMDILLTEQLSGLSLTADRNENGKGATS